MAHFGIPKAVPSAPHTLTPPYTNVYYCTKKVLHKIEPHLFAHKYAFKPVFVRTI